MPPARRAALTILALCAFSVALPAPAYAAAAVPAGKEVLLLDRIPGAMGAVRFTHAEHVLRHRQADGSPLRCRTCHHTLTTEDPPTPLPPMRCSGCHPAVGQPARIIDGKAARPMAALKPEGPVDYRTILFHDYCRDCHKKIQRQSGRRLAACKACHEHGITSESLHGPAGNAGRPVTPAGRR